MGVKAFSSSVGVTCPIAVGLAKGNVVDLLILEERVLATLVQPWVVP
jgi:hypothetical protein